MPEGRFVGPCHRCKSDMWLPQMLYDTCKRSSKHSFFCPYGHEAVFSESESEATLLRRERDRLQQQLAEKDDTINWQAKQVLEKTKEIGALKGIVTKARKRSAAGICPCCHRTFRQMALHMKSKHPAFKAEEAA